MEHRAIPVHQARAFVDIGLEHGTLGGGDRSVGLRAVNRATQGSQHGLVRGRNRFLALGRIGQAIQSDRVADLEDVVAELLVRGEADPRQAERVHDLRDCPGSRPSRAHPLDGLQGFVDPSHAPALSQAFLGPLHELAVSMVRSAFGEVVGQQQLGLDRVLLARPALHEAPVGFEVVRALLRHAICQFDRTREFRNVVAVLKFLAKRLAEVGVRGQVFAG